MSRWLPKQARNRSYCMIKADWQARPAREVFCVYETRPYINLV